MLQSSNETINYWLTQISAGAGFSMRRIAYNHWQLDMRNTKAQFTLDVFDQDGWITYGTVLMPDVEGQQQTIFYEKILELNAQLYGAHIGIESGRLILMKEDFKENFNLSSLGNSLYIINGAHQEIFTDLIKLVNDLGLRFKSV